MDYFSLTDLPDAPKGKTGWPWTGAPSHRSRADGESLPNISIVTPSLNQGEYIEETIRSVLLQNYPGLEYGVVDGGSSDHTIEILQKYSKYISWWMSESDTGQSHAINKGIRRSRGDVVGWLNSDDVYQPGGVIAMGRAFGKERGADLIYGSGGKIDKASEITKLIPYQSVDTGKLQRKLYFVQPAMFFSRKAFNAVGGLDEDLHYVMDWDLVNRFVPRQKIYAIENRIGFLRSHDQTKTSAKNWRSAEEVGLVARRQHGWWNINSMSYYCRLCTSFLRPMLFQKLVRKIVERVFFLWGGKNGHLLGGRWPF